MEQLPIDIHLLILQNLTLVEILRLCQSNKSLNQICQSPTFWRTLIKRDFIRDLNTNDPKSEYIQLLLRAFARINTMLADGIISSYTTSHTHLGNYTALRNNTRIDSRGGEESWGEIAQKKDKLTSYWYWSRLALSALGTDSKTYDWIGNKVGYYFVNYIDSVKSNISNLEKVVDYMIRYNSGQQNI